MSKLAGRLTYANVMATIAVFIALGGASYAAVHLPKNSVGTSQLKKNSVTAAKIKDGAISGAKINLSSLGTVPSAATAANAANASTLGGLTSAQIAEQSKLRCPAGTKPGGGVCIESTERPASQLLLAFSACGAAGMRLPSEGELVAWDVKYFTSTPPPNWVEPEYTDGSFKGVTVRATAGEPPTVSLSVLEANSSATFRCATLPTN